MKLHELKPSEGSRKARIRKGRGSSSGHGKTSGRGHKGQNARSGGGVRPLFEGGQTPLFKKVRKVGFTNIFRKEYAIINLNDLNRFDEETIITPELLKEMKIIKKELPVKVLGNGTLEKALTVKAHKFSKAATEAILAAGGNAEVI